MTITQDNYLDLGNLFINEFFGGPETAILVILVVIAFFGLKYRLPAEAIAALMAVAVSAIIAYSYFAVAWIIILLLAGIMIYVIFAKMVNK